MDKITTNHKKHGDSARRLSTRHSVREGGRRVRVLVLHFLSISRIEYSLFQIQKCGATNNITNPIYSAHTHIPVAGTAIVYSLICTTHLLQLAASHRFNCTFVGSMGHRHSQKWRAGLLNLLESPKRTHFMPVCFEYEKLLPRKSQSSSYLIASPATLKYGNAGNASPHLHYCMSALRTSWRQKFLNVACTFHGGVQA